MVVCATRDWLVGCGAIRWAAWRLARPCGGGLWFTLPVRRFFVFLFLRTLRALSRVDGFRQLLQCTVTGRSSLQSTAGGTRDAGFANPCQIFLGVPQRRSDGSSSQLRRSFSISPSVGRFCGAVKLSSVFRSSFSCAESHGEGRVAAARSGVPRPMWCPTWRRWSGRGWE